MSRRKDVAAALRSAHARQDPCYFEMIEDLIMEAANLLDPPDDGDSTIEVRVLVRVVDDDNHAIYEARGEGARVGSEVRHRNPASVASSLERWEYTPTRDTWITARVPKPEPVAEVEGTVDS